MSLDEQFGIGRTIGLGHHTFDADEIVAFAVKYDPQRFHVSAEEAKNSVFGALCASGWHTMALWSRHNAASIPHAEARADGVEFGPAAGFTNLQWLKPVFVGDTIAFSRTPRSHRPLASRPGWHMVTSLCEAVNQNGAPVMRFEVNVLIKA